MNIDRWVYPRPRCTWTIKQHLGEMVWIPVHETADEKRAFSNHSLHESMNMPMKDYQGNDQTYKEAQKLEEIDQKYMSSLGVSPSNLEQWKTGGELGNQTPRNNGAWNAKEMRSEREHRILYTIPCLFLKQNQFQNKLLLYFHSNAEDVHLSYEFCKTLMIQLNVAVLAVEYPGYGHYTSHEPSERLILQNALAVFDFLTETIGIDPGIELELTISEHLCAWKVDWVQSCY